MQIRPPFYKVIFLHSFCLVSLVLLADGVVRAGWPRRRRAGLLVADRPHTRTHRHATHTFTLTHSLHTTSSSRFIHTLPAQSLNVTWHSQPSSILGSKGVCVCVHLCGLTCFVCLCLCCCDRLTLHTHRKRHRSKRSWLSSHNCGTAPSLWSRRCSPGQ